MAKFCSECGSPLDESMRFCENCGAPCDGQAAQSAPEPAAQPAPAQPEPQIPAVPVPPVQEPVPQAYPAQQPDAAPSYQPPTAAYPYAAPNNADRQAAYPYATPVNADRKAAYPSTPNLPGESDKKSHLGVGIAIAVIAVLLIAAAIVVFFVWKPFDKKDDSQKSDQTPAQSTSDVTLPAGTEESDIVVPTQPAFTAAPTEEPTQAVSGSDQIPASEQAQIRDTLIEIVDYGYSRTRADVDKYLDLTFEYHFCSSYTPQELRDEVADVFYDDVEEFEEEFGSDYVLSTTFDHAELCTGEDYDDALDYYADDCDVSKVQAIAKVYGSVLFSGSEGSDTKTVEWNFIKVNGHWYPAV